MKHHVSTVLVLALCACRGGDLLPPPPPPLPPSLPPHPSSVTIGMVSGNNQQGTSGTILAQPFAVRVLDALGRGVPGVEVSWALISGAGDFWLGVLQPLPHPVTLTDAYGMARVYFRPTMLGASTVSASAGAGVLYSPVTFTVESADVAVVVIHFGPIFDCYFGPSNDPSLFEPVVTVSLGMRVEWEYAAWLPPVCEARIVSISAPPGESFDSGILYPGQRFAFVPGVVGEWVYVDSINVPINGGGGGGTLRVR